MEAFVISEFRNSTIPVSLSGRQWGAPANPEAPKSAFWVSQGDDNVTWIKGTPEELTRHWRKYYASDNKKEQAYGLGFQVKEYRFGSWWDIDFCSKKGLWDGRHWVWVRDPVKAVTASNYYRGQDKQLLENPGEYNYAVLKTIDEDFGPSRMMQMYKRIRLQYGYSETQWSEHDEWSLKPSKIPMDFDLQILEYHLASELKQPVDTVYLSFREDLGLIHFV